jgi:excisionase family DNA binding protein
VSVVPLESSGGPLLLEAGQVAALLGVGKTKVFEMMASGELPVVRIGRLVRVPRAELEQWVRERTERRGVWTERLAS